MYFFLGASKIFHPTRGVISFYFVGGPGAVPPAGVQGAEPLGGGQRAKPPEAPVFLTF